jgi:hemolysin activation/secretion protein
VGGKQLWGRYPYHEAAVIGGPDTVRGLRRQRYAGDASAYGNAELRQRLFDFMFLVPIDVSVFGLADGGRVFLDGEDSDRWHHGFGGGIGLTFLRPENTLSIAAARGSDDDKVRLYFQGGFGF